MCGHRFDVGGHSCVGSDVDEREELDMWRSFRRPVLVLAMSALSIGTIVIPVSADDGVTFTVDSVEELYAAVAVPGAIVKLEPGQYLLDPALDPTEPKDGRLDLAARVVLRGAAMLSDGPGGLPNMDSGGPVFKSGAEPAVIDGSALAPDPFGLGIVVVGHSGTVRDVWVRGSAVPSAGPNFAGRPGIEIVSQGTVTGNVVESATVGVRVRATSDTTVRGTVSGNFVMDSGLMGVVVIPFGADGTFTSRATINATISANRIARIPFNGIVLAGGFSGDDNVVTVASSHNSIHYADLGMFVETRGGGGFDSDPTDIRGANRNTIEFTSTSDTMDGVFIGYLISGAIREYLFDPGGGPPLIGGETNDNTIIANIRGTSITNVVDADIVAEAATTAVFPPPPDAPVSGFNNTVVLTLENVQGSGNPFNVFVADSVPEAPGSGNDVVIVGSRDVNMTRNGGLDFSAVADSDFSR
jgi:hypothetical protein